MSHALKAAIEDAAKAASAIADRAIAENRELSEGEQGEFTANMQKALDSKRTLMGFAERKSQLQDLSADLGTLDNSMDNIVEVAERNGQLLKSGGTKERKSVGQQFVESKAWTDMIKSTPGGRFSEQARVHSSPFGVKALLTGADHADSAGALVQPDYRGLLDPYYQKPLTIRSLVTSGNTTSDSIEFVRLINENNAADIVPEATEDAAIGAGPPVVTTVAGGLKPQSFMEFEPDVEIVHTVAHWLAATKRALSDAAQIKTLIDNFLRYGLEEQLEWQMVSGTGGANAFTGILNTSGIQTDTGAGATVASVEAARRARRKVQIGGRTVPTAFAYNPIDWEKIELLRDTTGQFYGNGPFAMGPQTLWGLPVVESESLPAGTAICADWRQAVLWDREQASIQVSDQHADFFTRNLVAILAELRAAFTVIRPPAFCKITLT